jgi:hypothetical protein
MLPLYSHLFRFSFNCDHGTIYTFYDIGIIICLYTTRTMFRFFTQHCTTELDAFRTLPNAGHFFLSHRLLAALNCGRVPFGVVTENVELWQFVLWEPDSGFHS